jgi:hypothetical protein
MMQIRIFQGVWVLGTFETVPAPMTSFSSKKKDVFQKPKKQKFERTTNILRIIRNISFSQCPAFERMPLLILLRTENPRMGDSAGFVISQFDNIGIDPRLKEHIIRASSELATGAEVFLMFAMYQKCDIGLRI